ncbi:unnamed protein product [Rotaria sp. Silwood2]|nr:unnamed protein product [Rotaria sp. Silwood2]CAF4210780.1 unnamed protein product [Rotaria sp. Silwood2]
MFHIKYLFYFILLHFIFATTQVNIYYTDWINENESSTVLQHDCLRVSTHLKDGVWNREIISFCMNDLPSKFHIENNNGIFPKFTFAELSKQNITSQQLYIWSAPINTVERYQFYLNQISTSYDKSLETQIFFNCTLPRFGSMCQYELLFYHHNWSLYDLIMSYYLIYEYDPTNMTCYTHLQCNRGPFPACLDWSEICNGHVDCLDGEFDEEHCWQLEINECNDNEYRCTNGQCIPKEFVRDDHITPDCVDGSDESRKSIEYSSTCTSGQTFFECTERTCENLFLTNSCMEKREYLLMMAIYSIKDNSISEQCWAASKCILEIPLSEKISCGKICENRPCKEIINNTCPDMFYIPNVPLFFGDIYFAFRKNDLAAMHEEDFLLYYVCPSNSHYNEFFINETTIVFNNRTCFHVKLTPYRGPAKPKPWYPYLLIPFGRLFRNLKKYNVIINHNSSICDGPNIYQCANSSKCISTSRIMDTNFDCPQEDDEDIAQINSTGLSKFLENYFNCEIFKKYIHRSYVDDGICHCPIIRNPYWCEDENVPGSFVKKNISFQNICDQFTELFPILIEGQNETDETECEQWSCNNIYTRCDGIWNCPNGKDEIGCYLSSILNCSSDHHLCVSPHTNELMCLSVEKGNDGKIDCLGATDEPTLCYRDFHTHISGNFFCIDDHSGLCIDSIKLCNENKECKHGDDEQFCVKNRSSGHIIYSICYENYLSIASDVEQFLCRESRRKTKQPIKYFSLGESNKAIKYEKKSMIKPAFSSSPDIELVHLPKLRCHHGIDLRVWLNDEKNLTTNTCLCQPSFYGDQCQYQNQRVSLTVKFQALSDSWSTLFAIIISLIDDSEERIIHSHEQFSYLSGRDCKIKFNIYLLYSTRPKDQTKNYAIHIDIYEKVSLSYRGSLLFPIKFLVLPIQRLAFIAVIPRKNKNSQTCSNYQCIHGKCIIYSNHPHNPTFCQCNRGWSGRYCTIPHTCTCSSDSIYIGVSAYNRSICVCPINKFGYQCLLVDTICQMNNNLTCQNGGQCISADEYSMFKKKVLCICPIGYFGDQCEKVDSKIILKFRNDIVLSQSIFIHFIEVIANAAPIRVTTLRTIPPTQNSLIVYWSRPFHLVFIELENKIYYLAVIQKTYEQSTTIDKIITPSDRCQHINELFNETFVKIHLLRRIKYYHLPCQRNSTELSCFYDDRHICLCYDYEQQRLVNCFEFNHNMKFDCFGQSVCENEGQCFQDSPDCPQRSVCICPPCFYGIRCQFSASGFGLSLDPILGYHIQPHISFIHQPNIVIISSVLTLMFIVAGFINGILSLITFNNKITCEVGCGLYLLGSSITTLLTTIIFGLKFWILVLVQMATLSNRSFLQIECLFFDFILRVCLNMDQWLNACVATERTITMIKGAHFRKKKSKRIAKIVIIILLIFIISTSIYDPLHRRLIDEENEDDKRLWCITTYSSSLRIFNSIIHTFHFLGPFIINLVSSIMLVTKTSRQKTNLRSNQNYKEVLFKQIRQHKHLFTAPVVLVILAIPRLIISFISKCMKSTNDAWLFLIGYFISFIPPMLTFVIFILPSKFYKEQLRKTLIAYRTRIQRRFEYIN